MRLYEIRYFHCSKHIDTEQIHLKATYFSVRAESAFIQFQLYRFFIYTN